MSPRGSLTSSRDFGRVYRSGRRARENGLTVWAAPSDSAATRLGLAVGARVGPAVIRNRIRRRLRALFRDYRPAPGFDVVVRAERPAAGRTFQELAGHLDLALRSVGVERQI